MIFKSSCYTEFGEKEIWECNITKIQKYSSHYEISISYKNSKLTMICGKCEYDNFICIPEFFISTYIYKYSNRHLNLEMLQLRLDLIDSTTISDALYNLYKNNMIV